VSIAATSPALRKGGFRRLWVSLRALFHEVTGAMFAVLALAWLNSALRGWTGDVAHWLIAITVALSLLFLFFSITSFRRARKIQ
jgi:cobalamin synthase